MGVRGRITIAVERPISAPATEVYTCVADYRAHHHRFLPPAFSDFAVEEGGVGAGTIVRFRLKVGGRETAHRARIDEPVPGHRLTETDLDSGSVTTFEVLPVDEGCRVRIETAFPAASGPRGLIERSLAPRLLRPIYRDEVARLDRYARERMLASESDGSSAPG